MEVIVPRGLPTLVVILVIAGSLAVLARLVGGQRAGEAETAVPATQGLAAGGGEAGVLRVMTANVRYSNPEDGENAWPNRRELLVRTMLKHGPDIIGMQEVTPVQGAYLVKELDRWYEHFPRPNAGRIEGASAATNAGLIGAVNETFAGLNTLFYKKERFEMLDAEAGLLVPEQLQTVPSENTFYTLVVLREKATEGGQKKEVIVVDTHLRHGEVFAARAAGRVRDKIAGELKKFAGAGVVVMGDMNHDCTTAVWRVMTRGGGKQDGVGPLADGFDYSKRGGDSWGTYHAFTGEAQGEWPTDLIFAGGGLKWEGIEILRDGGEKGVWPTDHFLVMGRVGE